MRHGRRELVLGGLAAAVLGCRARGRLAPPASDPSAAAPDFSRLRGLCDGIAPADRREIEARVERLRRAAADAGLDAVLMEAGVNQRFCSEVRWHASERAMLLVIPTRGQPLWIGPTFEEHTLRGRSEAPIELHGWHEHESPGRIAAAVLGGRFAARPRVGVDPALRLFVLEDLRAAGVQAEVAATPFVDARICKAPEELARLRRANEATQAALRAVAETLTEGMDEPAIAERVAAAQRAAGLEDPWGLVLVGDNAALPHGGGTPKRLRAGDPILVDAGGSLHGFRSDITRTWSFGPPSPEFARAYATVLAAQTAALAEVRAGRPCEAADRAARTTIAAAGYGEGYAAMTHRLGHGIGVEGHEPPYLVPGNRLALRPGMTTSVEPGIYLRGRFGVRIEDIVAVGSDGCEVFGTRPTALERPFG